MHLTLYGTAGQNIAFDELIALQKEDGDLWAHAEDSGCESCYCEVARWSHKRDRWERFAFVKCYDVRLPDMPDATDEETAHAIVKLINDSLWNDGRATIVHRMPAWEK